ncbi:disease resistance protein RUN1-like [Lactuca sativa]|uniref:disease resistance protein RUN1-like n=1 Tax=Lactuca sativa TaxID=4236 RepID=UPI000CD9357A|nr:disease resistance protein RUN1-like [Lactuca sativa]
MSRATRFSIVEEALAYPSYSMHLFSTQKIEKDTIETIMHEKKEKNKMRRIANEIAVGQHAGKRVFLPRIPLCPSDDEMFPFKLKRMQFPVQHSFSMTINKAQGQTIPNFPLQQLIGIDNSIKVVTSWLKDASSNTIDILTILGMGGIGKTSLAKYVYVLHFHEFDTSSFIEGINRRCVEKSKGPLDVQKELCDDISKSSSVQVHDDSIYTLMIEHAIGRKKVILVLDDIGSLDQLDSLLRSKGFHTGSKIIITTKDAWLTESYALFRKKIKPKHAIDPKDGYEDVSKKIVKYCEGHPMAIKVLGRSLHNRDVSYWEGDVTVTILEACDIETRSGITKLIDRCLLSIGWNKELMNIELMMHQLVQEMGRFIVRKESLDKPWERS